MSCVFCDIINQRIPVTYIYEDNDLLAFPDINPIAPTHILIIPKKHITTLNDFTSVDAPLIGKMNNIAIHLAKEKELSKNGYRLVMNCNNYGGQSVYHVHLHLIGGRQLQWPPG